MVIPAAASWSRERVEMSANDPNGACAAGCGHADVTGSRVTYATANERAVVDHDDGCLALKLTGQEKSDLVQFLRSR
jgi:hypothetical protein